MSQETNTKGDRTSLLASFVVTGFRLTGHFIALVVLASLLIVIAPRVLVIYDDYDLELPGPTLLLLDMSTALVDYWYLFGLVALLFDGIILFALSRLPANARWLGGAWSGGFLLGVILFLSFAQTALFMALNELPVPESNQVEQNRPDTANDPVGEPAVQ
jgi:hypothetical protein